MFVAMEKSI